MWKITKMTTNFQSFPVSKPFAMTLQLFPSRGRVLFLYPLNLAWLYDFFGQLNEAEATMSQFSGWVLKSLVASLRTLITAIKIP